MNGRGTILVVDDTPESLRVLTGVLQQEGYTVRPANSGKLALASIAMRPPDLILLDIRMPGLDGFEVCRRLKGDDATKNIPVIFQSAATDLADRLEGLSLGAVDDISKPFQREELLARVKTHLELALLREHLEVLVAERTAQMEIEITERKRAEKAAKQRLVALTQPMECGTISFGELFNLDDVQQLQDEFALATGVASIITHTDGTPLTVPSNFSYLCNEIIRKTERGCANCFKSDAALGRYHPEGPIIQPCLSGSLWDAGAGITVGGHHIANWLIGQVRDEAQTEEKMLAYAREIGADETSFMKAFREVPAMSRMQFERIAKVLFTLASQLSTSAYQNIQQARFITERNSAVEALQLQTVELEEEMAERQMAQVSLQEQATVLEEEVKKRQQAREEMEKLNEHLEQRVQERTAELREKNAEVQQAYNDLKRVQGQLLQQDKMASVGQLAAGVAHEINTPMGFIISNLSSLGKYVEKLKAYMDSDEKILAGCDAAIHQMAVSERQKYKIDHICKDMPELISESREGAERVRKMTSFPTSITAG
jgi:CheY-like chemotaxis protein